MSFNIHKFTNIFIKHSDLFLRSCVFNLPSEERKRTREQIILTTEMKMKKITPRAFFRGTTLSNHQALPAIDLAIPTSNGWHSQPSYPSRQF